MIDNMILKKYRKTIAKIQMNLTNTQNSGETLEELKNKLAEK